MYSIHSTQPLFKLKKILKSFAVAFPEGFLLESSLFWLQLQSTLSSVLRFLRPGTERRQLGVTGGREEGGEGRGDEGREGGGQQPQGGDMHNNTRFDNKEINAMSSFYQTNEPT